MNTQITRILKRSTAALKELRSLSVGIVQCRPVPNRLSHLFCYLTLNDIKVCRTQNVDMNSLFWGEDFTLELVGYHHTKAANKIRVQLFKALLP